MQILQFPIHFHLLPRKTNACCDVFLITKLFYVVVFNGKFLKPLEIQLSANISAYRFISNNLRLLKDVKSKETRERSEGQTVVICVNILKIIKFKGLKEKISLPGYRIFYVNISFRHSLNRFRNFEKKLLIWCLLVITSMHIVKLYEHNYTFLHYK